MTCQEVIEYMQRYLDKDLSDSEHTAMLEHLPNCSNCTEIFERMKLLSNKLVNLPKVVPPYSIVDSIMPQLDEIDRAENNSPVVLPWSKRIKNSVPFKSIGGVVAAGIVFAVISLNGFPSFQTSSDEANMSMNTTASDRKMSLNTDSVESESISVKMFNEEVQESPVSKGDMAPPTAQERSAEPTNGMGGGSDLPEPMTSPDGAFTAIFKQEGTLYQVVIMNKDNEEVYATPLEEADYFTNLWWSDDSKVFGYQSILREASTKFVIDTKAKSRSIAPE